MLVTKHKELECIDIHLHVYVYKHMNMNTLKKTVGVIRSPTNNLLILKHW